MLFRSLHSLITTIDDKRIRIKITKMSPAVKENNTQLMLFAISEQERKLTLTEVIEYLESPDSERAIRAMKNE